MTPGEQIAPSEPKTYKRKRLFCLNNAMQLTSYVIKKFCKITETEEDNDSLPSKKRKISEHSTSKSLDANDVPQVVRDKQSCSIRQSEKVFSNALLINSSSCYKTGIPRKKRIKSFRIIQAPSNNKEEFRNENNNLRKTAVIKFPAIRDFVNLTSIQNSITQFQNLINQFQSLINQFQNSINFIRVSRLQSIPDIESIVSSFSKIGKVSNIQDHWIRPTGIKNQYSSLWMGATVTYKYAADFHRALKAFSTEKMPVFCVSLPVHLFRIILVEMEYINKNENFKPKGSSIIVDNIYFRSHRTKLQAAFEVYGTVLDVKWMRHRDSTRICEVTYETTTSAVAAALALDGKSVHRSFLRARIKMTRKEIFIHKKVCEVF